MQDVLVHHAVAPGRIAQGTDMGADNAADELGAQVGAHALRTADPVIPAGAFHGLVTLVHQDGDPVLVVRLYLRTVRIVGIPGIFGQLADAHHVRAHVVQGRLHRLGIFLRVVRPGRDFIRLLAVLQRHHGAQGRYHGMAVGRLGDHAEIVQFLLRLVAQVAQGSPDEHVVAFRNTRDVLLVDESRGGLLRFQFFHWIRAQAKRPVFEQPALVARPRAAQSQPPARAMGLQGRQKAPFGQRFIGCDLHGGGNHGHTELIPQVGVGDRTAAVFSRNLTQAAAKQQVIEIKVAGRGRVQCRLKAQETDVIHHDCRRFGDPDGCPMRLGAGQPGLALNTGIRFPGVLEQQDQGIAVVELLFRILQGTLPGLPAFPDGSLGHDIGRRTSLVFFFLRLRQGLVDDGFSQYGLFGYGAGCRHADIEVVTTGFQVIGALHRV